MKRILIIALTVFSFAHGYGQQMPESNLYQLNKFAINPAYAGYSGCLEGYVSSLSQWAGFDGGPRTNYFMVHSALPSLNENMAVGGQIVMDKTDMINRLSAVVSYSYNLNLGNEHFLRLGLSGGMYQANADPSNATVLDGNDAIVLAGANNGITFSSEFGAFYSYKNIQFGISVPEIFQRKVTFDIQGLPNEYYLKRNLQVYGSYKYEINDLFTLEPSVLYKTVGNNLHQLDITALGTYNNIVSLGLGYRTSSGLMTQLHVNIKDQFYIGYAYAVPTSGLIQYTSGSHEVMLGYKFCKTQKVDPSSL